MEVGRPTKYNEEYNEQAEKLCSMFGADDLKLAEYFGVCDTTIQTWKKEHQLFLVAVKTGKDTFDTQNVEKSLLKRAIGYKTVETHEECVGDSGLVATKKVTKHVVSDTAIIFWLKNRNPQRWRDRKAVELTGDNGGPVKTINATITPDMDAKEAAAIYCQMLKDDNEQT